MPGIPGPLGILPGLTYDPVTNRYYSTPKVRPAVDPNTSSVLTPNPTASSSTARFTRRNAPRYQSESSASGSASVPAQETYGAEGKGRVLPSTACLDERRADKRLKLDTEPEKERSEGGRSRRRHRLGLISTDSRPRIQDQFSHDMASGLRLTSARFCNCGHTGENINEIKAFGDSAYYATTGHGRIVFHRENGETFRVQVCAQSIIALHQDPPRMVTMAISTGTEAHIHHFRRTPENPSEIEQSEINLPPGEIFSSSSFDDACTLGGERGLSIVKYTTERYYSHHRKLKSDVLAVEHLDRNLVFAGLRNSAILLEDLRVSPRDSNVMGHTVKGRSVVGIKKLKDSVVPWGVAVSSMSDELLIFDARFGKSPLHSLQGHVNNYRIHLGMNTTPDDSYLFSAGSDNRIRAWSTRTGTRLTPPKDVDCFFDFASPGVSGSHPSRMLRRTSFDDTPGPGGDMSGILDQDDTLELVEVDEDEGDIQEQDSVSSNDDDRNEEEEDDDDDDDEEDEEDEGDEEDDDDEEDEEDSEESESDTSVQDELSRRLLPGRGNTVRYVPGRFGTAPHTPPTFRHPSHQTVPFFRREGTTSPHIPGRIAKDETNVLRRVFLKRVSSLSFHPGSWALTVASGGRLERFEVNLFDNGEDGRSDGFGG
ncbi:hypothetical protein BD324DRAFT_633845 [Kockovaella imperatae]|uniref:WD40-repeat-containing domain protein n=1 Tax=Kockovaella imperatae TaxID=4999 RepID=A0A1Y1UAM4_9TREE|nr:hypothetical protein BD324DRAFT_633845 [Kockovaella imperatae]ORX35083.1 hypothetical protein BD324DRAFT_633845 [Kockovaella imperatae]